MARALHGRFLVVVRGTDAGLVRQRATDRYGNHRLFGPLATAGNVADGQYATTSGGTVKATVSRQLAGDVRGTQSIAVKRQLRETETADFLKVRGIP